MRGLLGRCGHVLDQERQPITDIRSSEHDVVRFVQRLDEVRAFANSPERSAYDRQGA